MYGEIQCNATTEGRRYAENVPNMRYPTPNLFTVLHQRIRKTGLVICKNIETGRHAGIIKEYKNKILIKGKENSNYNLPQFFKSSLGNILYKES